ncbi:MAG: tetratricopeptide repeat protein [bacterium]
MKSSHPVLSPSSLPYINPSVSVSRISTGRLILAVVLLAFLCSICFSNSVKNSLLQWDDQLYVQDNPYIRSFSWSNLKTLFTRSYFKNYAPLHILSYQVDYHFWKFRPEGYRMVNILLHILNSILVFLLIFEWYRIYGVALAAGAIFAVHTIHVESVVWISQRKDVLSAFFFFLSLYAYSRFRKKTSQRRSWHWPWYACSVGGAGLALLAKPVTVTLPLILVLLEFCFHEKEDPLRWKAIIPFFLLAGLLAAATYRAQTAQVMHYVGDSFLLSLLLTVKVLVLYLGKLILPLGLSSRYVFRVLKSSDLITPSYFVYALLLLLFLGGLVLLWWRGKRHLAFPGIWFLITLLPVANLVPTSTQMADRYMYLPSVGYGLAFGLIAFACIRWARSRESRGLLQAVCILLLAGVIVSYCSLTLARNRVWRDDRSLWEDALAQDPNNHWAATFLANTYMIEAQKTPGPQEREESLQKARELFLQAIRLEAQFAPALLGMGSVLLDEGNPQQAIVYLYQARMWSNEQDQSLRIEHNLGVAYAQTNQLKAAEETFSSIIKQEPSFAPAYFSLGKVYLCYGTLEGYRMAKEQYSRVTGISPKDPRGYFYLAIASELLGDFKSALVNYQEALRLTGEVPQSPIHPADIHFSLAGLFYRLQDYPKAVEHYREVLRLNPYHPQAESVRSIVNSLTMQ